MFRARATATISRGALRPASRVTTSSCVTGRQRSARGASPPRRSPVGRTCWSAVGITLTGSHRQQRAGGPVHEVAAHTRAGDGDGLRARTRDPDRAQYGGEAVTVLRRGYAALALCRT